MIKPSIKPTERFTDRVDDYVKYRPSYPVEVIKFLEKDFGLRSHHIIADIGSGTGISAKLFLQNNNKVFGVEPNQAMRTKAEELLKNYSNFTSVNGTSEATNLPDHCVDFVVVAQAFHWFDPMPTKKEFKRILKPGGVVVILFNDRKIAGSKFSELFEKLLKGLDSDYDKVKNRNVTEQRHKQFLGRFSKFSISTYQEFDFAGLLGRLKSSSYALTESDPGYTKMVSNLKCIYDSTQIAGKVRMENDTQLFCARI